MNDREHEAARRDFTYYKDRYQEEVQESIAFMGQDLDFFTEVKARYLIDLAKRHLGDPNRLSVLDVGCGVGLTDRYLITSLGALYGVDLSGGVIEKAAQANPSVHYRVYDGKILPFSDHSIDLVFAIGVMHHVPPASREDFIREMKRVTRNGGLVVIFEHNPLNPLTRHAVNRCVFDTDAVLLGQRETRDLLLGTGLHLLEQAYILFFPFRLPIFTTIERRLKWLPLGAQYYVVGKKPDG